MPILAASRKYWRAASFWCRKKETVKEHAAKKMLQSCKEKGESAYNVQFKILRTTQQRTTNSIKSARSFATTRAHGCQAGYSATSPPSSARCPPSKSPPCGSSNRPPVSSLLSAFAISSSLSSASSAASRLPPPGPRSSSSCLRDGGGAFWAEGGGERGSEGRT
jgi:hypothetical protein